MFADRDRGAPAMGDSGECNSHASATAVTQPSTTIAMMISAYGLEREGKDCRPKPTTKQHGPCKTTFTDDESQALPNKLFIINLLLAVVPPKSFVREFGERRAAKKPPSRPTLRGHCRQEPSALLR